MRTNPREGHTDAFWERHDKDEYTCPNCDRGIDEVDHFQVHHKNGNPEDGSPENLVGLCKDCHWEAHDILPGRRPGHWSERFFDEYNSDQNPLMYL